MQTAVTIIIVGTMANVMLKESLVCSKSDCEVSHGLTMLTSIALQMQL